MQCVQLVYRRADVGTFINTMILPQLVRKQLQEKHTAVLSSGIGNTLIYEVSPGELPVTCFICDGSGHIKNDVPLKDALIETIKDLEDIRINTTNP